MELFLHTSLSFPTVVFTVMLVVVVFYWCTAALGLLDIDILDFDVDPDIDLDVDAEGAEGFAGLLMKLGLDGVPFTIVVTLITLTGWLLAYFSSHFILRFIPIDLIRYLVGAGIVLGAFFVSIPITAMFIKPLRPLFKKVQATTTKSILGQTAIVRSSKVTLDFGEATLEDGGAGLILRVRAEESVGFKRGDRVVLLEYLSEENAYRVISEDEFNS